MAHGFTGKLSLDVNRRWMMVVGAEEDNRATKVVDESAPKSTCVDALLGVDYALT